MNYLKLLSTYILFPSPSLFIVDVTGTRHPVCQVARGEGGGLITTQVDTARALRPESGDTGHPGPGTTHCTQSVLGSAVAVKARLSSL